jgi:hypothetical protein
MRCQKQGQRSDILAGLYPRWGMIFERGAIGQIFWLLQKPGVSPASRTKREREKSLKKPTT